MRSMLVVLFAIFLEHVPSVASAGLIVVDSKATGGFGRDGSSAPLGQDFVLGWTFTEQGQSITASGVGTINLAPGLLPNNGPNGITIPIGNTIGPGTFTPLEQQFVASGVITVPRPSGTPLIHVGALIAAFVPSSIADLPNFRPRDPALVEVGQIGLSPTLVSLLVGDSEFLYTSPGPGKLYFGINDMFPSNNVNVTPGGFTVSIQAVPEPTSLSLFTLTCAHFLYRIRRCCGRSK